MTTKIVEQNDLTQIIEVGTAPPQPPAAVTIVDPTASSERTLFYTTKALKLSELRAVIQPAGGSPSVTWTVRYASDRSAVGTEIVTGGTATTNTTTGDSVTSLTNSVIPKNSWVWVEITAVSGLTSGDAINISLIR